MGRKKMGGVETKSGAGLKASISVQVAGALILAIMTVAGCKTETTNPEAREGDGARPGVEASEKAAVPFGSRYKPYRSPITVIYGATILDGAGNIFEDASIVLKDGLIQAVNTDTDFAAMPPDALVVNGKGKWVTPGVIDIHSHLGVYPSPDSEANADGNEGTDPNTANVWAEHSVWPQDPGFTRALAGGVTSMQVLPGSANLFGGRSVILKNVPARTVQEMKFPNAPYGLKMACGENPKSVYGESGGPSTRMGEMAAYRQAWIEAKDYKKQLDDFAKEGGDEPQRDLKLETLAGVLDGKIRVNMHCYRADDMMQVLDLGKEFGFKIASFHHAVEAYKIRDYLAESGVCAAMWADWGGFKYEAYDSIRENVAMVHGEGACAIVHSDSSSGIQRLNQEAGKALFAGRAMGIDIPDADAISWITSNPARAMGISDRVGSLGAGKMADVVVWSGNPFSVYSLAEKVFIDGALLYDRSDPKLSPRMDVEIGQIGNSNWGGAGQ